MNKYKQKQRWNFFLFIAAVCIGIASLRYTNQLVKKMAGEERKKAELLAEATRYISSSESDADLDFYTGVIEDNETVPVIVVDTLNNILFTRNLDSARLVNPRYLSRKLHQMQDNNEPIIITLSPTEKQYLYFSRSIILQQLSYYPYVQLGIILLFILVAYFAFNTSRKFEQNQVWVGLSKETAHQLGTPISSLLAWLEMMKMRNGDKEMLTELEKDVIRLEKITERFSKIGSKPVLAKDNVVNIIITALNYVKTRSSGKIRFSLKAPSDDILIPLNAALFEWVIENLCKNAIDSLNGQGEIEVAITDFTQVIYIDILDTGKGIPKSMFNTIFKPGFTTKKKGWGLGLSLAKRIVEEYHDGKIFVHQSELNKGSVLRIVMKK
ncbi:MAG TPA: HAMP domain-containing sensor histidine kinase [Bacteroidales bacterium]|nr:HAMP domain-containing sensor histidine kinase [Bacteroidales bacterium]